MMKLVEVRAIVDREGRLILSEETVSAAGFHPGNEVYVTLTVPEEESHPGPLMPITLEPSDMTILAPVENEERGCEEWDEEDFSLPCDFLQAAGIPDDSDLDVTCVPGAIIIRAADILNRLPKGLKSLFQEYGIAPDTVREVMREDGYPL